MTTQKKILLVSLTLLGGGTIFYFAYWRIRNTVLPKDVPAIANNTVALSGTVATTPGGVSVQAIEGAIISAI